MEIENYKENKNEAYAVVIFFCHCFFEINFCKI